MSNRAAFFDALTEELPDDVWGLRLQEELSAHLEDAVYFGALEGKTETLAEEQALADLGSPTLILKEFRHAMVYKSSRAFILHAIGVGLIASPLVFFATVLFRFVPIVIPVYLGLFALYVAALAPLFRHIEGQKMARFIPGIVAGIPMLLVTIPVILSIGSAFDSYISASDKPLLLATTVLAGTVNGFVVIAASRLLLHRATSSSTDTTKQKTQKDYSQIVRINAVAAIIFIVVSTILQHNASMTFTVIPSLRWILDQILTVPNALSDIVTPIIGIWVTGAIICGAGAVGLYFIVCAIRDQFKKKDGSFPWAWLAITTYAFTLVVFPAPTNTLNVQWADVPHALVSERIERSELGPFYSMSKYLNRKSQNVFSYHLSNPDTGNAFEIQQYPDHVFTLTNITSVDSYDTASRIEDTVSFSAATNTAGIWCHYFQTDALVTDPIIAMGEKVSLENLSPVFCTDLYVGEKKIFDAPQGIDIGRDASITVSEDGKWLLFAHDVDSEIRGSFTPTEVYLIDLR